ncbi:MAG: alginate export family protein [Luteolibacter sp.]
MKKLLILTLSPTLAFAGPPSEEIATVGASEYWIKPTLDIRARYEFGDTDGLDPSHAFTIRERLGLQTQEWNGFSAFVEGEFSQAAIDDYNGAPPAVTGITPDNNANTQIFDPETNELNQGYIQYKGFDTTFRAGRQRVVYDNAAFIGNVGWRQNEQTYDALSVTTEAFDEFKLNYAYINQVNRIFGNDASGFFDYVGTDIHLLNGAYTGIEGFTFGGYVYLMDFGGLSGFNNDTYGGYVKTSQLGLDLYGEIAYQDNAGPADNLEGTYAHVTAGRTFGSQAVTVGMEYLSQNFRTPLATVHAFNGFADAFIGQRLAGTTGGLTDVYVSHTIPFFFGTKFTNVLHAYGDNEVSTGRGWEYDAVLVKKFDEHFLGIAKFSHFESESPAAVLPTTTRFSMELNYTF